MFLVLPGMRPAPIGLRGWSRRAVRPLLGVVLAAMAAMVPPTWSGGAAELRSVNQRTLDVGAVDSFVIEQMAAADLPGAAVAITRADEVLHVRGFGHDARGEPITGDTPFRVASVSKSFTSLAVLQLVESGKLRLDEPVRTYLTGFETADPRSARITVRQLLNQTSGLADRGFAEVSLPQPGTRRDAVERLRDARLVAEPGTQWNYHNPNYHLAARLVEVVSSESFATYLQRHVLRPLGMDRSTTTATDDEDVPGLADGHSFAYGTAVALPGPGYFVAGSGGVVTSAADMARWLVAQNNGGVGANGARVLSAAGVTQLHTPSEAGGYALGWDTDGPTEHPTRIEHGGCCFAWAATQALLPDSGYGIAVLFNSASPLGADQGNVAEGVIAIVEGESPHPPPVPSSTIDLILAVLTLAALVLGILGVVRARRWATRRAGLPAWRVAAALLPDLAALALCLRFPVLAGLLFGGRDVTWFSAAYGWFALAVLVAATALAAAGVVTARVCALLRLPAAPPPAR